MLLGGLLRSGHRRGSGLNRFDDVVIARAAADVAFQPMTDLVLGGCGVHLQQFRSRHDHARSTEPALQTVVFLKSSLQDTERTIFVRHAFNGRNLCAFARAGKGRTRLYGASVDMNNARAALRRITADMRSG